MPHPDNAEPVDVDEVLPPEKHREDQTEPTAVSDSSPAAAAVKKALPGAMARLLDECITIPKTKIQIGLDPIIGFFFPAIGDAVTATLGTTILFEALRRRLPRAVVIRMGANIALNAAIGAIPFLGDLFSVWFKSNAQNHALLERHSGNKEYPQVKPSLWPLFIFILGVIALIALVITGLVTLFRATFLAPPV